MCRRIDHHQQLSRVWAEGQIENAGPDLLGAAHANLDSDTAVDSPVHLAGANVRTEREDGVVRSEAVAEGHLENVDRIRLVSAHSVNLPMTFPPECPTPHCGGVLE